MDSIADILTLHVADEIPNLGTIYTWAIPTQVPVCLFNSDSRSLAESNFGLKRALAKAWQLETTDRYELANWYVGHWGGIRTNKPTTIQKFVLQSEDELGRSDDLTI